MVAGAMKGRWVLGWPLGLLAGCMTLPPAAPPGGPAVAAPAGVGESAASETADEARTGAEASRLLLRQSRAERAAGNYAEASASLERAIRIDPRDPLLWLELGYVKLAEGDRDQARSMAERALALAAGDRGVESSAERLLALSQAP